jgi:uncharacterized protein YcfL
MNKNTLHYSIILLITLFVLQGCNSNTENSGKLKEGQVNITESANSNITATTTANANVNANISISKRPITTLKVSNIIQKTITEKFYPCHRDSDGASFIDNKNGWKLEDIEGSHGMNKAAYNIYKTKDGGNTWTKIKSDFYISTATGITFLNNSTGWITCLYPADEVKYYKTTDGGITWTEAIEELTVSEDVYALNPPSFFSNNYGIMIIPGDATVLTTEDGGNTWTNKSSSNSIGKLKWNFTKGTSNEISGYAEFVGIRWNTDDGGLTWVK